MQLPRAARKSLPSAEWKGARSSVSQHLRAPPQQAARVGDPGPPVKSTQVGHPAVPAGLRPAPSAVRKIFDDCKHCVPTERGFEPHPCGLIEILARGTRSIVKRPALAK